MQRRDFLRSATAVALATLAPTSFATDAGDSGWRSFELSYEVDIPGSGPAKLWLPLPRTMGDYEVARSVSWSGTAEKMTVAHETDYGTPMFSAQWSSGDGPRKVAVAARVAVRPRSVDLTHYRNHAHAVPDEIAFYLRPSPSMPIDGVVAQTARLATRGTRTPLEKAHAIYEWVIENTHRDPATQGCGRGNIKLMLETGNLGGKCADISSLFAGLARAAGVPARESYGIRVADSTQFKCLGKSGDISKAQHCRAEFWLAGLGWVPVDPADVRKVVLEEKLPLDDARVAAFRKRAFGAWEMNWVSFNFARDIDLVPPASKPFPFLMYPQAETSTGMRESLDPASFRYRITSRELAA
jgi:transglutaminase-like putative cysteine protease